MVHVHKIMIVKAYVVVMQNLTIVMNVMETMLLKIVLVIVLVMAILIQVEHVVMNLI